MNKTRVEYAKPEYGKEEFVRHIFSKYAKDFGFDIINIQKSFPDCTAIDRRNNRNKQVYIELEYKAGNFISHEHHKQMQTGKEYIIICWDDTGSSEVYKKVSDIEIITLSEKKFNISIEDIELIESTDYEEPLYRLIHYNTNIAYGKPFEVFENVKIFRTNQKFKSNYLPKGSVIVLCEGRKIIGEFTVVSYHFIPKKPETDYEKKLYRLISFPVTLAEDPLQDEVWTKGHILYTNFKKYDPKVPFSILNRNKSHGNTMKLTKDEIELIRGKK